MKFQLIFITRDYIQFDSTIECDVVWFQPLNQSYNLSKGTIDIRIGLGTPNTKPHQKIFKKWREFSHQRFL